MNDRRETPDELEQALHALADTLDIATPPDYAQPVLARLARDAEATPRDADERRRFARPWSAHRPLVLRVAAVVLITATVLTITLPGSRRAVASWFGFAGIDITSSPSPAPAPPTPSTPFPLYAGPRVTLAQAQEASGFRVELPAGLGRPDGVFLRQDREAVLVTIAYRAAPPLKPTTATGYALIVTEIYDAGNPLLQKILHTGASAVLVSVGGDRGVFVDGPQEIINLDYTKLSHGSPVAHEVAARASANTLIWSHGTTTFRLEGDFSQKQGVFLAESFH